MGIGSVGPDIAFLWHLHQPPYRDPETGVYLLPWVRLHATRGYLDLAEIHRRFPGVRSTVNFSPILLEQLEEISSGRGRDRFFDLSLRPAGDLSEAEKIFLLSRFFMVNYETGVKALPRYGELLHKRGLDPPASEIPRIVRSFTQGELRDLQVLFQLAWMGFAAREKSEIVRGLVEKGRRFTEEEKVLLLDEQMRLVGSVIPLWKELAEAGTVELSASPYAHPILPLLCDTDSARIALPGAKLPPRLRARDDAEEQVRMGFDLHTRIFGKRPNGMWPSEGSVSPEALEVMREAGVRWTASDEEVLLRSLPSGMDRQAALSHPWNVRAGAGEIPMVFRDRGLSDRIGFSYARARPGAAVDDLLGEVARIGNASGSPLVPIILDGENPWEYYPSSGREFLTELFSRLERRERGIDTTTISDRLERMPPSRTLEKIHSGSWIEGSFRIWMGHSEDVAAWSLVGKAKEAWEGAAREGKDPEALALARRHLLLAEASDWFWWYGEDFVSDTRGDFDLLFRHFIQATFAALGEPPPEESLAPLIPEGRSFGEALVAREPAGFLRPRIDGQLPSYWEWLGSGLYLARSGMGQSMHLGTRTFERMFFGFDEASLFIRLDPEEGREADLSLVDGFGLEIRASGREMEIMGALARGEVTFRRGTEVVGHGCVGSIVEIQIPFAPLGLVEGQQMGFAIRALRGTMEVQRLPGQGFLALEVPGPSYEDTHWKV